MPTRSLRNSSARWRKNPDHPGAIHLYIHAVEASDRPERAQAGADRLAALIPGAGHIVHMPSHIYYRVGRYLDALDANKAAVAVDESYIGAVKPTGPYPLAYYPHNVHFLLAAAQLAGDSKTAWRRRRSCGRIVAGRGGECGAHGAARHGGALTGPVPCSASPMRCWRWPSRTTHPLT